MSEPEAIQWVEREGRHIAMLGVIEAGDVVNWHGNAKWCGAYCRLFLPQVRTYKLFGAKDIAAGRRAVEEAVLTWIEAAGLAPATARETAITALAEIREKLFGEGNPMHAIEEALVPLDHALNQLKICAGLPSMPDRAWRTANDIMRGEP